MIFMEIMNLVGITHKYIIIIIYIYIMVGYQSPAMPTKNKVSQTNQALVL